MKKTPVDETRFGNLRPKDTFLYYDGPLIYSTEHKGKLFYVHAHDWEAGYSDYFVRAATEVEIELLQDNQIELRTFLSEAPELFLVRVLHKNDQIKAFQIDPNQYLEEFPKNGVYLYYDRLNHV